MPGKKNGKEKLWKILEAKEGPGELYSTLVLFDI